MKNHCTLILLALLPVLLLASGGPSALAQPAETADKVSEPTADQAVGSQLPTRVRVLLIREMMAIQNGMNRILDALVRGQDDTVAELAQAIHDSFILKQEMTPEDRKSLLAAVPEAFVTRDRAFHALGGHLAEAARNGDREEQLKLYAQLVTACTDCHAMHARDRFPEFAAAP